MNILTEIQNHKHRFEIEGQEIELTINYRNGLWSSQLTKGKTGMADSTGGKFNSLDDYIKDKVKQHTYTFNFFKKYCIIK